jgi:hypothetical protein
VYLHDEPKNPTKEGPLSYVLLEFLFASVSTVDRGHPGSNILGYDTFRGWGDEANSSVSKKHGILNFCLFCANA